MKAQFPDALVGCRGPDESRQARVRAIGCGEQHTAVLLSSGEVYAAGSNEYGACALGDDCNMEVSLHVFASMSPGKGRIASAMFPAAASNRSQICSGL